MYSLLDQNNSPDDYFKVSFDQPPPTTAATYAGGSVVEAKPSMEPSKPSVGSSKAYSRPASTSIKIEPKRSPKNASCAVEYSILWTAVILLLLFAATPVK
jgi:hypothetical protein